MSAPTTSHDLRCVQASSPDLSVPCTCSRGSVLRLPVRVGTCAFCGGPADFRIDRDTAACEAHVGSVLRHYFETSWDGWQPCAVTPIRTAGGAA